MLDRPVLAMSPSPTSPKVLGNFLLDIRSVPTSEKFTLLLHYSSCLQMLPRCATLLLPWHSNAKTGNLKFSFSNRAYLQPADRVLNSNVQPDPRHQRVICHLTASLKSLFLLEASSKLHCIQNEVVSSLGLYSEVLLQL